MQYARLTFANLSFLLLLFMATAGCQKDDTEPFPETGTLTGRFSPNDAVKSITAINSANKSLTVLPSAGNYQFMNLAPGSYQLKFEMESGYNQLSPVTAVVQTGLTTSVPIQVATQPSGGGGSTGGGTTSSPAAYSVNGGTMLAAQTYSAQLTTNDIMTILLGRTGEQLSIVLQSMTTVGTFQVANKATIRFTRGTNAWRGDATHGSGSVQITSINLTQHKVSGSFSCTLAPEAGTSGNLTVQGSFSSLAY